MKDLRIRKGVALAFFTGLLGIVLGCGASAPAAPTEVARPQQPAPAPAGQTTQPSVAKVPSTAMIGYEVGDHIPDFDMTLISGEYITSTSLLSEGKPIFLFFTASW